MRVGVTVGKFYPLHRGHDHLIREAKRRVDRLVVLVGDKPEYELPGELRAGWIRELHPDVDVRIVADDIPEAPEPWARRTLEVLGGRAPDVAFTSEDYGSAWAEGMGARHEGIDPDRRAHPISGTRLRADLGAHWGFLTPPAKAWFARRVCVLGVESSGTTTLARALAARYRTAWVPEYGRQYWEGRRFLPDPAWEEDELVRIAHGQARWEEDLARKAERLLICDTDALATNVWHRRYRGDFSEAVGRLARETRRALYLLTEPDFPFVQDGTRERGDHRARMHAWFQELLEERGVPYVVIGGAPERRLAEAAAHIDPLLRFPVLPLP